MEYLRGNAPASATALYVICCYLSAFEDVKTDDDLRESLEVLRSLNSSKDEVSAVLKSSLAIGEGLGLIARDGSRGPWSIEGGIAERLRSDIESWPWFRGELLYRIGQHALSAVAKGGKAPDLAIGLSWFLQLDPLGPPPLAWGAGPERMVREIGFESISRSDQWRPFRRWALATGLARICEFRGAKVLIPDASTAIADQFENLPLAASARDWLSALQARLPFLGSPELVSQLPQGGKDWLSPAPGAVLGLLKLEQAKVLKLEPSDDAADVVAVGLNSGRRQIGRISLGGSE
jgi:hypothetical protein